MAGGKTGAAARGERRDRRRAGRRAGATRRRADHVRRPGRPRLPAGRRRAGHLGRPGGHRQAGLLRPAVAQEVAAGHVRAGQRRPRRRTEGMAGRTRTSPTTKPCGTPPTWSASAGGRDWALAEARRRMLLAEEALTSVDIDPQARAEHVRARAVHRGSGLMTQTTDTRTPSSHVTQNTSARAPGNPHRHVPADAGAEPLAAAVAHLRALQDAEPAGGRASSPPTSRWTPRTCCCVSSSASGPSRRPRRRPAGSARSSGRRHLGHVLRRPGRPVHDRRGVGGAAAGRRCAGRAAHGARRSSSSARNGGLEATRVFTRIWLALVGLWSWDELPELPPEMVFLPRWFPLNVYDFGCWARQTVVPLTIVGSLRPVRPLPFDGRRAAHRHVPPAQGREPWTWAGFFHAARPRAALLRPAPDPAAARLAKRRAAEWILARQETDGSWGGIQPPWVYSILALHLLGYPLEHPALRAGLAGLDGFTIREETPDGWVRRLEACQSPVWDTGAGADRAARRRRRRRRPGRAGRDRLAAGRGDPVTGDWSVRRPELAPGGWAFEFANDGYPDTDDTAEIVLALRRVAHPDPASFAPPSTAASRGRSACSRPTAAGARSTPTTPVRCRTSCRSATSARSSTRRRPTSPRTSWRCSRTRARPTKPSAQRGVAWLLANQEPDGSWFGRWGANYVYGTGAVVPALVAAGVDPAPNRSGARSRWLVEHQNPDGGWGEDLRSYEDPARGPAGARRPPRRPRGRCSRCSRPVRRRGSSRRR